MSWFTLSLTSSTQQLVRQRVVNIFFLKAGMHHWKQLPLVGLGVGLLVVPVFAGGIRWGNELGSTAIDSQGASLDSSWTFYLGYFEGGYAPNAANSAEWSNKWTTLDVSGYSSSSGLFGKVWDNDGASAGRKGYIWGVNRNLPSNEWILFTASGWVVPVDNPLNPDSNWFTSDAETIVAGSITGSQLQTAVVAGEPPLLSGEDWLQLNFNEAERSNPLVAGWSADPDHDGRNNLEEFAFGTNPSRPDQVCVEVEVVSSFLQFSCQRARAVKALYYGQVSADLTSWSEGPSFVALQSGSPNALVYRDLTPISPSARARFGRVRVSLIP